MRVVVDTNVLFEGLNRRGVCGRVVDAWVLGSITACVSTALALEYEAVVTRGRAPAQQATARRALQALLDRTEFVPITFSFRPQSPDPDDDLVIDCAVNAAAPIVASNVRHFRGAAERLGFDLMTPAELVFALGEV